MNDLYAKVADGAVVQGPQFGFPDGATDWLPVTVEGFDETKDPQLFSVTTTLTVGDGVVTQTYAYADAPTDRVDAVRAMRAEDLCDQVDAIRDTRLAAGFTDSGDGLTGKTYECDPESQGKLTALATSAGFAILMAADPMPTYTIVTEDNSQVTLSAAETFALIAQRAMAWISATLLYGADVKAAIRAGNAPDDINAGWP